MNPIGPLVVLRDLSLRMDLPPELLARVKATVDTNLAPMGDAEGMEFVERALSLGEECVAFLDSELRRVAEVKFSAPDPNALRQRLLSDPRRQAEAALTALKARLLAEKQEWVRRVAKQLNDVQTALDQQIDSIEVKEIAEGASVVLVPDVEWLRAFDAWRAETYARWATHLASVLPSKTRKAIETDLETLGAMIKRSLELADHPASSFKLPTGREKAKEYRERFDVPTVFEAFFDSFKERLNTVAMIAGLVVIPVIGSLMHTASTTIRAAVMGATLLPILGFSFLQGRRHRKKLFTGNLEKAKDRLKKSLATEAKGELDRFKLDAERYTAAYCGAAQQAAGAALEPQVAEYFEALEKQVARDLASAQMESDKSADQINVARQLKGNLTGQLLLELKRRQVELRERAASAKVPA